MSNIICSPDNMVHIISLGAGVQSSAMALMAANGEITPMPQLAIFADTGWESEQTYQWLHWLEKQLPYPVVKVSAGNIRNDQHNAVVGGKKNGGKRWASLPYFTKNPETGKIGMVRRQCTNEYKIQPIEQYLRREILKLKPRQRAPSHVVVTQWRGISIDESIRMKPSGLKWLRVRYPLTMEKTMSRQDCKAWMKSKGYKEPPRSACLGCPFHSNKEWGDIKTKDPVGWDDVVNFDKGIRKMAGMQGDVFLHRSCQPLGQVVFSKNTDQLDLWGNECEGMCGL